MGLGEAWVDVHANTDPFQGELERGVREGAEDAEDDFKKTGEMVGEAVAEGAGDELRRQGPHLAKQVEEGLKRTKVRTKVTAEFDRSGNEVRRWVSTITDEVQEAFTAEAGRGGIFSRIRLGIADAIGAGFNVSGRSPLIALLVPLIGAIVALVIGAIQAINGLIAALTTVPTLLASIGLQVGILFLAFKGVGTAVQGAFAAKNAKELKEAIKDLTPAAQEFVKSMLPLRDLFKDLRIIAQESFFTGLGKIFGEGGALTPFLEALRGLGPVATRLGELFQWIARAFGSPTGVDFLNQLFAVTDKFLTQFGPALNQFFFGLLKFAGSPAVISFLSQIGEWVTIIFTKLGGFLFELANNEGFAQWMERMKPTLESLGSFLAEAVKFAGILAFQLDKAGGQAFLDQLTEAIATLNTFLASDVGRKGLEGLMTAALALTQVFIGLIAVVLLIAAAWEKLGEIVALVFEKSILGWKDFTGEVKEFVTGLPERIWRAFSGVGALLFQAGRNVIQGFINGIKSMFGSLSGIMSSAMQVVRNFTPFSPAKEGPLSGSGDPYLAGQNIMERLGAGIQAGSTDLRTVTNNAVSNISFGPGAIKVGFEGALPTRQQATETGSAVGAGIMSILGRNVRLAVRTT